MSKGCKVCAAWHETPDADVTECGHWCHFAGAEDWDPAPRAGDGQEGDHAG